MKKKFLALLLGGVMTVGGLFLQMPATAQADDDPDDLKSQKWQDWTAEVGCNGFSDTHIASSSVDVVNGLLTVTLEVQTASEHAGWGGFVYVSEAEWEPASVGDGQTYYDFFEWGSSATARRHLEESGRNGSKGSYQFTFEGLTADKPYYVYCQVWDPHGIYEAFFGSHYAVKLGSGTPTAASASSSDTSGSGSVDNIVAVKDSYTRYLNNLNNQIKAAQSGLLLLWRKVSRLCLTPL